MSKSVRRPLCGSPHDAALDLAGSSTAAPSPRSSCQEAAVHCSMTIVRPRLLLLLLLPLPILPALLPLPLSLWS